MKNIEFGTLDLDFSDRPVYVVGGGPSLTGFDFERLDGYTIGANKTAFVADTDVLVSIDVHFIRKSRDEIEAFSKRPGKSVVLAMPTTEDVHRQIPSVTYLIRGRTKGISRDPGRLCGVHSGYSAMNVAFLAGAKEIGLLGIDMNHDGQNTHFHGGYPWGGRRHPRSIQKWANDFELASRELKREGVSVVYFRGPMSNPRMTDFFESRSQEDL